MSRERILDMIRQNKPPVKTAIIYPAVKEAAPGTMLKEKFRDILEKVGGVCIEANGTEELNLVIGEKFPGAVRFDLNEVWEDYREASLQTLEQLNTVLLKGQFGVAENAAIWLDDSGFPKRVIPFIAKKVVIILDSSVIVEDMHQAYNRISSVNTGFGLFVSGPSKTADIEQSLVYGAHGPVSLTVILY
jgi:L-lactate dehydrogenase complex protein LldG